MRPPQDDGSEARPSFVGSTGALCMYHATHDHAKAEAGGSASNEEAVRIVKHTRAVLVLDARRLPPKKGAQLW